jgi:hypothetical protein
MTTPDYKDALVYATIKNEITENNFRTNPGSALFMDYNQNTTMYDTNTPKRKMYSNFLDRVGEDNIDNLNNMLSNTTIKRACCLGNEDTSKKNFRITVKIPYVEDIAKNITPRPDAVTLENWRKLGYMHKEVLVPKNMCPGDYKKPTNTDGIFTKCDKFYQLYCENSKLLYNMDVSGNYNEEDFRVASPDCGCYLDKPASFPTGIQPACYTGFCYSVPVAFTDPATRKDGACNVNNCTSVFNIGDLQALTGGQIDAQFNLNQTCGSTKQLMDDTKAGKLSKEELARRLGLNGAGGTNRPQSETGGSNDRDEDAGDTGDTEDTGNTEDDGSGDKKDEKKDEKKDVKKEETVEEKKDEKGKSNMLLYIGGGVGVVLIIIIIIVVVVVMKGKSSSASASSSGKKRRRK